MLLEDQEKLMLKIRKFNESIMQQDTSSSKVLDFTNETSTTKLSGEKRKVDNNDDIIISSSIFDYEDSEESSIATLVKK